MRSFVDNGHLIKLSNGTSDTHFERSEKSYIFTSSRPVIPSATRDLSARGPAVMAILTMDPEAGRSHFERREKSYILTSSCPVIPSKARDLYVIIYLATLAFRNFVVRWLVNVFYMRWIKI